MMATWTEEGGTLSSDEPSFGRVKLEASKLTLTTYDPNELLQDSKPALDTLLRALAYSK
jgi:HK97 family phage major capsid protein